MKHRIALLLALALAFACLSACSAPTKSVRLDREYYETDPNAPKPTDRLLVVYLYSYPGPRVSYQGLPVTIKHDGQTVPNKPTIIRSGQDGFVHFPIPADAENVVVSVDIPGDDTRTVNKSVRTWRMGWTFVVLNLTPTVANVAYGQLVFASGQKVHGSHNFRTTYEDGVYRSWANIAHISAGLRHNGLFIVSWTRLDPPATVSIQIDMPEAVGQWKRSMKELMELPMEDDASHRIGRTLLDPVPILDVEVRFDRPWRRDNEHSATWGDDDPHSFGWGSKIELRSDGFEVTPQNVKSLGDHRKRFYFWDGFVAPVTLNITARAFNGYAADVTHLVGPMGSIVVMLETLPPITVDVELTPEVWELCRHDSPRLVLRGDIDPEALDLPRNLKEVPIDKPRLTLDLDPTNATSGSKKVQVQLESDNFISLAFLSNERRSLPRKQPDIIHVQIARLYKKAEVVVSVADSFFGNRRSSLVTLEVHADLSDAPASLVVKPSPRRRLGQAEYLPEQRSWVEMEMQLYSITFDRVRTYRFSVPAEVDVIIGKHKNSTIVDSVLHENFRIVRLAPGEVANVELGAKNE